VTMGTIVNHQNTYADTTEAKIFLKD